MELEQRTYNLTRKLYSDARRLIANADVNEARPEVYVLKEDFHRLHTTLMMLKNAKKED
jgi:hypothetical protein